MRFLWSRARQIGWLPLAFCLLIGLPASLQLLQRQPMTLENRAPAPPPALPHDLQAWLALPGHLDAWFADRFGLRAPMLRLNNWLRWKLFGELSSTQIVVGRNGRLFLGAHDASQPDSLIRATCGDGIGDAVIAEAAARIEAALATPPLAGRDATLLIVPTAPRLYPEDVPDRLAQACRAAVPAADRLARLLATTPVAAEVVYPLALMQSLKSRMAVIPPEHFHWAGEAPLRVAELVAESQWHLPKLVSLKLRRERRGSDLNTLNPGIDAGSMIDEPVVREIGLRTCVAAACAAATGLPPSLLAPLEVYRRDGPGGRLLVVGDLFGDEIGRDFTEYFAEIWLLHLNLMPAVPLAERPALTTALLARFAPPHILVVYHDAGALGGLADLRAALPPE